MRGSRPGWHIAALGLALLIAGSGLLLFGLGSFLEEGRFALARPSPTATPLPTTRLPTATEPILPPPPTAAPTETVPLPTTTETSPTTTEPAAAEVLTLPPVSSPMTIPSATGSLTPSPTSTTSSPVPSPTIALTQTPRPPLKGLYSLRERIGVGGGVERVDWNLAQLLDFGWYLDWTVRANGFRSGSVAYMPMIRLRDGRINPDDQKLLAEVDALPGALWLIGNEPDVKWQDNVTPDAYAQAYYHLYSLLKGRDPNCRVAIGGVAQPTPLRLRYLDMILEAYQTRYGEPMPVDVWNVHNFILREEMDGWGVDIPPGMADQRGRLYEIADHDDMTIFRQQIVDFRRWMKERGEQDKPLIVTEYGILMPGEYGFPPKRVERFMLDTFEFFRTATDPTLGYSADGYRLVQQWCWFSLVDERYPTGNLIRLDGRALTPLGKAFKAYVESSP